WSMGVFVREFVALATAFSQGSHHGLAELPVQYADFAHWQRRWLTGDVLEAELAYWRRQLANAPQRLELPTDHPRPAMLGSSGRRLGLAFSEPLSGTITALARRQGATPFMILLAAFKILLSRWTDREDIVVGSPIAGRNRKEIEGLIGFFVNTLVLRSDLSGRPGFDELLKRIRRVALDAFAHQDVAFERLVEELQP
ncbi:MAG: non-ribosomal peptide synthetase, partial [bacterium]|nr:non-ribosomal peptide synthetase [bacterium]